MSTQSRASRWSGGQVRRRGKGGGVTVVHRLPRFAGRLPHAPTLSDRARFRLRCVEHAQRDGVAAAMLVFGVSRATVDRWRRRDDPRDLTTLEPRSRRPRRVRRATWTAAQEQAVRDMRERWPRASATPRRMAVFFVA